jgi:hypothetical protein
LKYLSTITTNLYSFPSLPHVHIHVQKILKNKKRLIDTFCLHPESTAYKPAYKENPKTGNIDTAKFPPDLAEIIGVWDELPKHLQAAVIAMIQIYLANPKG